LNKGVEILLARMDSHPDEFPSMFDRNPDRMYKWDSVIWKLLEDTRDFIFITEDERSLLIDKYRRIQGEAFTKYIMKKLTTNDS
jgi:hypothetical protein